MVFEELTDVRRGAADLMRYRVYQDIGCFEIAALDRQASTNQSSYSAFIKVMGTRARAEHASHYSFASETVCPTQFIVS